MRFVIKPDAHITPKLASNATRLALLDIATNMTKDRISDSIYRDSYDHPDEKRSRVEDRLARSYHNKCGYCERLQKADIEHYRPKKAVAEDNTHHGYYWLCYEWTNLIPACVKCNRDGAKHSKFPILGNRVRTPSFLNNGQLNNAHQKAQNQPLLDEIPLLLHPEVDNPELYFDFLLDPDGEGIRIRGIDNEGRGESTIGICLLNRQELKLDRVLHVINPFKQAIESTFGLYYSGDYDVNRFESQIFFLIRGLKLNGLEVTYDHTLLRKFIIKNSNNFQRIVLPYLNARIRGIVLAAFEAGL